MQALDTSVEYLLSGTVAVVGLAVHQGLAVVGAAVVGLAVVGAAVVGTGVAVRKSYRMNSVARSG
jgi:hypothetical protein